MEYNSIIKFGRILFFAGFGWLSAGLCVSGGESFEQFDMWLAVIAIIVGLFIVFIFKNKAKLEELQSSNNRNQDKICPHCGLSLSNDCKECPKCNTTLELDRKDYGSNNN